MRSIRLSLLMYVFFLTVQSMAGKVPMGSQKEIAKERNLNEILNRLKVKVQRKYGVVTPERVDRKGREPFCEHCEGLGVLYKKIKEVQELELVK